MKAVHFIRYISTAGIFYSGVINGMDGQSRCPENLKKVTHPLVKAMSCTLEQLKKEPDAIAQHRLLQQFYRQHRQLMRVKGRAS